LGATARRWSIAGWKRCSTAGRNRPSYTSRAFVTGDGNRGRSQSLERGRSTGWSV
jgi:hypothetical protein